MRKHIFFHIGHGHFCGRRGCLSEDEAEVDVKEVTFRCNLQVVEVPVTDAQDLAETGLGHSFTVHRGHNMSQQAIEQSKAP